MAKKKIKLSTPAWILEGYDSPAAYNKAKGVSTKKKSGKTFKIRKCPECDSDEVGVVIGEVNLWECRKCKWKGSDIKQEELTEDEFMKYLDEKGEDVA
ncbi:hypothetical protein GOV13_02985 [Candidatus Pacearchaeota archaeon]|nr:hypothetical protein [Candidatus Pacearchaeota archaeon]